MQVLFSCCADHGRLSVTTDRGRDPTFADYPRLKAPGKTNDEVFTPSEENWEQKTAAYEKGLAELRQQVSDMSTDLSKIEELTSIVFIFRV